jgi:SAM-dependent methyltransferase
MNWKYLRHATWLDTRSKFVGATRRHGALLDLGSSTGETLGHFAQLRPDLRLFATDIVDHSEKYPSGCQFQRSNLETDKLCWPDNSMDAITCMHLVEHLKTLDRLMEEVRRLLKPGGRVYFETPHPKTLALASLSGSAAGTFTMNFYDDPTHVHIVPTGALAQKARQQNLKVTASGTSRNWLLVAARLFPFLLSPLHNATARTHWIGWSAYLIARQA